LPSPGGAIDPISTSMVGLYKLNPVMTPIA
jgi:hypothetical protein